MKIKHEKLTPTLPDGHKWRKDYVLCVHPGTPRHTPPPPPAPYPGEAPF